MRWLILLTLLCSCQTHTTRCIDLAEAQYNEICRRSGSSNAQLWELSSDHPSYTYHRQAMERRAGVWYWVPNHFYIVELSSEPQGKCKPLRRLK